ncbi:putative Superoxide dismutase (Cu-Zn) [Hypsibius exemplaris]|uniref:Superoxide dismutase [Cu-Zn] n=1 Tax=Hypsibius exemplaris TaxID=2072580 RepID=A0A1W0WEE0_HYPEX|nr:putative Superoxide dismutase (Cu-Zn) [Hypsibius exemplaris]
MLYAFFCSILLASSTFCNPTWDSETMDDNDYSESGMPVTDPPTTTTTTTTEAPTTTSTIPQPTRASAWFAIPESAFPFPLIPANGPIRAIAVLEGSTTVKGLVVFDQKAPNEPVIISARITGLEPNGERGLHVHSSGDLSKGCETASSHFNPFNLIHGAPGDTFRHAGDLGNVKADSNGNGFFSRPDFILSLSGPFSVLGRSVVIHERADDLGRGETTESRRSGNAGARVACGVIGTTSVAVAPT